MPAAERSAGPTKGQSSDHQNTTTNDATDELLDVRLLARRLSLQPIELVRELQADGVPMVLISTKRWRVGGQDYERWLDGRRAKAAEHAKQHSMRVSHAAGAAPAATNKAKVRFRR